MVIAHCPLRLPVSLCNPTLFNGLRSLREVAASKAAMRSWAASVSMPGNLVFLPCSKNFWLVVFAQDFITSLLYYVERSMQYILPYNRTKENRGDSESKNGTFVPALVKRNLASRMIFR